MFTKIKLLLAVFFGCAFLLGGCNADVEDELAVTPQKKNTEEFEGIEVLFDEKSFSDPMCVDLLKEINICSDAQINEQGEIVAPCTPEYFKFFPLKEGVSLFNGFILLVKSNTGGIALRRVLVFEREQGVLVKTNGFIANLIGKRKKKDANDDILLRFIDKIEGSDVFYHCLFSWENGKYEFKSVELIHEPAGDFARAIKAELKDSVSKEIFKVIENNKMVF